MITTNREDYLRILFCLNEKGENKIKSIDIARILKVSKPAVSEMLKKLKKEELIEMMPYSNISLTEKGFEAAKKTTYKHRIAEVFLKEVLKFKDKELHEEAHRLEHSMSEKVAKRISKYMKNPRICPCGHKIPNI